MTYQEMLARRANVWATMQEIQSRSNLDNAEDRAAWDAAEADLTNLSESIERLERSARMGAASGDFSAEDSGDERSEDADEVYARAFDGYLRRGLSGVTPEQRALLQQRFEVDTRAQSSGTTTTGGYAVPQGFWNKVTETMKAYGGLLTAVNVINTDSGNAIPWPTVDDTAQVGALLAENTQITSQDLTFGQNNLGAYMYTSKLILASWQFLQDTAIDAEAFIAKQAGIRLGRAISAHLATGTGSGQPTGVAGSAGFATGKTGLAGQTTSVIFDDLIDLEHSVDPAYRQAGVCKWAMADSSLKVIRKLKDGQNRPLWEPSVQLGVPSSLLGYPVVVDNGMPAMAVSAKSIAFGDFSSGVVFRQVNGGQLIRLEERYADYLQTGFFAFGRFDARIDDAAAVRLYVNSAT